MPFRNSRVVLLSNPTAGHGEAALDAARAIARLRGKGIEVEHIAGVSREHAEEIAHEAVATRPAAFLVVGGDGGVSVGLQAVAGSSIPLGIVPGGSSNDAARNLGIPIGDVDAATDIVARARIREVDLGRITLADETERFYIGIAGADYSADVAELNDRLTRLGPSRFRYLFVSVARSLSLRSNQFSIVADDGTDLSGRYFFAIVGNMGSVGAGITLCPDARVDDGLLDLTRMTPMPFAHVRLAEYLAQSVRGGLVEDAHVDFTQVTGVTMDSPNRHIYADGELVGPLPARIDCVPRAVRIIVP